MEKGLLVITLDLGLIAALLGLIGSIVTLIRWIVRLNHRFERLERHDGRDHEALCVLTKGMTAALDGLKQLGANSDVTEAGKELKSYMLNLRD